jgi:hypothetical protein
MTIGPNESTGKADENKARYSIEAEGAYLVQLYRAFGSGSWSKLLSMLRLRRDDGLLKEKL